MKREISSLSVPKVEELSRKMQRKTREQLAARLSAAGLGGPTLIIVALGVSLLLYLFHCYCCMLICLKTGHRAGNPRLAAGAAALSLAPRRRHVGLVVSGVFRAGA